MNAYRFLALAFIAGLVAFSCVQSVSIGGEAGQSQQQQSQQQGQHGASVVPSTNAGVGTPANTTSDKSERSGATTGRYLGSVNSYEQPQQAYQAAPVASYQTESYAAPVQQQQSYQQTSYQVQQPQQSYSQPQAPAYQAPQQPAYQVQQQSYSQPQAYEQPKSSYVAPVSTYEQPKSSYVAPVSTYEQPMAQTYQAPPQTYQQQNYTAPVYQQQQQTSYQQSSYQQPSYQQQSYVQPTSYQTTSYSNYSTPSYQPQQQQQSYVQQPAYQPQQQSYVQPTSYQTQSYSNYSTPSYQQTTAYVQPSQPTYSNYSTPSYQQTTAYAQPSQPTYSNYSAPAYTPPVYTPPVYTPPVYTPPVYTPPATPTYSNYSTPSYQPVQQTYTQPQVYEQTKQEYVAPVTAYQAPAYQAQVYQNYSTPSYQPVQQSYAQPQVSYQQPQTYQAPVVETTTYQQPSYQQQTYQQPSYQQQTYQQPSYQPVQQSYQQPSYQQQQQSYQPQQTYQQPSYQQQTYQQPSYQPVQQSYQQPSYQQQTYQQQPSYQGTYSSSLSGVYKRQLGEPEQNVTAGKSTLLDDMSASDSIAMATYVPAPVQVYKQQQQLQPIVIKQQQQRYPQQQQYLDTQPEFTQSWADYSHPPGYLPQAYRSIPYFIPNYIAQQPYGKQPQQALALSPLSLGYGYVTWSGPIDPKSFYTQYHLPYYYKYPPLSPFYSPNPYRQQQYQIPALVKSVAVTTVRVVQPKPVIKVSGYGKRSLNGHEAAPYAFLVDHLAAAASDKNIVFANVSAIECPAKPSDYVCPQVLNAADKETLKKEICKYETVLTGTVTLVPDTEKAQTRCGAIRIEQPIFKSPEDKTELANKMAVVFGKGCQLKQLYESQTGQKLDSSEPRAHFLLKSAVPSTTKFILADGANMDLLNANLITREEIVSMFKQCKASS